MSSSQPPSKPPSQAGKFKPKKQKPKKSTPINQPTSSSLSSSTADVTRSNQHRDKSPSATAQGSRRVGGRGGRGGRGEGGRGRGRGHSGRFIQPKGQVFFTASSTASNDNQRKAPNVNTSTAASSCDDSNPNDGNIIMPGMTGSTASKSTGPTHFASSAQGRLKAAAQARKGEGNEIIIGEMEDGKGVGDMKKSNGGSGGILDRMSSENRSSLFDGDDDDENVENMYSTDVADFTYDSDSSTDGAPKRIAERIKSSRNQGRIRSQPLSTLPQQLPLPPTRRPGHDKIDYLYECQIPSSSGANDKLKGNTEIEEAIMDDPPLEAPFLNLKDSTPEQKLEEQKSWVLFKFPTRLPRLAPQSTISGMKVKSENGMDIDNVYNTEQHHDNNIGFSGLVDPSSAPSLPDAVISSSSTPNFRQSSNTNESGNTPHSTGYDDTLKDTAAGRYGKIVVYKSGKAYLVIGDNNNTGVPPIRMRLSSGLPCGFLQQAVSIDVDNGYIPLGEVKKSVVVTPDVEMAFQSRR